MPSLAFAPDLELPGFLQFLVLFGLVPLMLSGLRDSEQLPLVVVVLFGQLSANLEHLLVLTYQAHLLARLLIGGLEGVNLVRAPVSSNLLAQNFLEFLDFVLGGL